jgi:hypothetical protein
VTGRFSSSATKRFNPQKMVQKTALLALDEGNLISVAIEWIIQNALGSNDSLILCAAAHPPLPGGKSSDGFITIRKKEAELVKLRLETIAGIVAGKIGKNIKISAEVGIWKLAQADHVFDVYQKFKPDLVYLFFDPDQQPWVSRTFNGTLSSQLSNRIPKSVVITTDILKKFEDQDIFGL